MSEKFDVLQQMLEDRFSCRAYLSDPVAPELIEQIIAAARHAASWCNAQPWQVTITSDDATDRFRTALLTEVANAKSAPDMPWPEGYPGVYGERRRACGYQLYDAVGIARDDREARAEQSMRNFHLFDAPHVAIVHSEIQLGPYGALDCGGFVTAFMLAATALGLGCIAQASVAAYPNFIRAHFNLPASRQILCAISFGYADPDHPANQFRTSRAAVDDVLDHRS